MSGTGGDHLVLGYPQGHRRPSVLVTNRTVDVVLPPYPVQFEWIVVGMVFAGALAGGAFLIAIRSLPTAGSNSVTNPNTWSELLMFAYSILCVVYGMLRVGRLRRGLPSSTFAADRDGLTLYNSIPVFRPQRTWPLQRIRSVKLSRYGRMPGAGYKAVLVVRLYGTYSRRLAFWSEEPALIERVSHAVEAVRMFLPTQPSPLSDE